MTIRPNLIRPQSSHQWQDQSFRLLTLVFALAMLGLVGLMVLELLQGSWLSILRFGWSFLTDADWDPVFENFGALPFLYGTLISSLLALSIALPVSLGIALFLTEIAPQWLYRPISFVVELLAAIPSVVYGLWGLFVLAPWVRTHLQPVLSRFFGYLPFFQGPALGVGMLSAGLILAVMITPIVTAISREVIMAVPTSQREAALALGATRWEMIRLAILPYARSGLLGAVLLGLGRALGETMAVTMVIGNRPEIAISLFAPGYSMASVIANEFSEATYALYLSALMEIGLLLFGVTMLLNFLARLMLWRLTGAVAGTRE